MRILFGEKRYRSSYSENSKHEIPAFAEAATRRQAKFEITNLKSNVIIESLVKKPKNAENVMLNPANGETSNKIRNLRDPETSSG